MIQLWIFALVVVITCMGFISEISTAGWGLPADKKFICINEVIVEALVGMAVVLTIMPMD